MKPFPQLGSLLLATLLLSVSLTAANDEWPVHPDSVEQPGVPKGEILTFTFDDSKVFPARPERSGFTCPPSTMARSQHVFTSARTASNTKRLLYSTI